MPDVRERSEVRSCLVDDEEWVGLDACPSCGGEGVPGRLADYCPHGKRKPYRGWPCPSCRAAVIETARKLQDLGGGQLTPGWQY